MVMLIYETQQLSSSLFLFIWFSRCYLKTTILLLSDIYLNASQRSE